jgi:NADPH:quinone reductase-like Zn-dependent oxidoreductase
VHFSGQSPAGTQRSWHWEGFGEIESLRLRSGPVPEPGPKQVLVRIRASSLNRRDVMVAQGIPVGKPLSSGLVPLSDGAGDVVAVGTGVSRVAVGERVAATFRQGWIDGPGYSADAVRDLGGGLDGMLREYAVFDEQGLVRIPDHLSYQEAATLPCAAVTAWNALMSKGAVRPGEVVLTQGSGGVSLFALQFARLAGARVIATTSDDIKAERLRALGASDIVNYREHPAWSAEVLRLTEGRGVDLVVEIGGPGTLVESIRSAREGGRVVLVGLLTGFDADTRGAFLSAFLRDTTLSSVHVGHRRSFEEMNCALGVSRLHPVIDRTFPFDRAPEAYAYLMSGAHFGKVVINHE